MREMAIGCLGAICTLGAIAGVLPTNTCIVSGDLDRTRDGVAVTVNHSGALDSWWRSFVEVSTSGTFYTNPCMGLLLLFR